VTNKGLKGILFNNEKCDHCNERKTPNVLQAMVFEVQPFPLFQPIWYDFSVVIVNLRSKNTAFVDALFGPCLNPGWVESYYQDPG
jgi:hypothetical protein